MDQPPAWTSASAPLAWPTEPVTDEDVHCALQLPAGWSRRAGQLLSLLEVSHNFRGDGPGDCVEISWLKASDPQTDLREWVDGLVRIVGFPVLALNQEGRALPQLEEWEYLGSSPLLARRLEVDETHLYQGLGSLPGRLLASVRIYVLVARRQASAWKVGMTFETNQASGADEAARAGATFGTLKFL